MVCGRLAIVPVTDPETVLRLRGERGLFDDEFDLRPDARTLLAVGALSQAAAESVLDDYRRAFALRGRHMRSHVTSQPAQSGPDVRMAGCPAVIEQDGTVLELRLLTLSSARTALHVRARRTGLTSSVPSAPGRARHGGAWPPELEITDDRGTTVGAEFSGSGSETEMDGMYQAWPGLAPDTAWINVAGRRIELVEPPARAVTVERSTATGNALVAEHLEHVLSLHGWGLSASRAIDVLIDAGTLSADDPLVARTHRIKAALDGETPDEPPEPWSSIVRRRGNKAGPVHSLTIGAATPDVDGCRILVLALDSTAERFTIGIEVDGAVSLDGADAPLDVPAFAFTAADDRGNRYLGWLGSGGWSSEHAHAEIVFEPALDPEAKRIDLVFSTGRTRATVPVGLA